VNQRATDDASYEIYHDALGRPILEWRARRQQREDAARREELARQVERERAEKERAQQLEAEAQRQRADAERRAALELRRKRVAVSALIGLVTAGAIAAFILITVHEHARTRRFQRAEASNVIASKLDDLNRPLFDEGQKALAAFEAYRLSPTFDARKRVQAALQENPGMPLVLAGHRMPVLAAAWQPGAGGLLATGSADDTVRLWQPDGKAAGAPLIHLIKGFTSRVTGLSFTANGRVLAVAHDTGAVDLWAPGARPRFIRRLEKIRFYTCGTEDPCQPLAFSPDGQTLVTVDHGDILRLWAFPDQDPQRARRLTAVHVGEQGIHALAFSPTGNRLAVGSQGGVSIWRLEHGRLQLVRRPPRGHTDAYSVAWSPSGELAAGTDGGVRRWDEHGDRMKDANTDVAVRAVGFARGGAELVTGGDDEQVTTWDDRTGRAVGSPKPHTSAVEALAVSPDGNRILAGDDDAIAKIWPDRAAGALAVTAPALHGAEDLVSLPGGLLASYTDADGSLRLWRLRGSPDAPRPPEPLPKLSGDGAFAASGSRLVALAGRHYTQLTAWDVRGACARMATNACRHGRRLGIAVDADVTLALDRSGTTLAVGTDAGRLTLWDIRNPRRPRRLIQTQLGRLAFDQLAFDPHARRLLVRADATVRLWSYAAVRRTHRLEPVGRPLRGQGQADLDAAAFSPRARVLALGGEDQTVTLLDLGRDPAHPRVDGTLSQSNSIDALAYSPDGRVLAAGDGDGKTCVYDMTQLRATGAKTCLVSPGAFGASNVSPVVFDATGRTLVTDDSYYDITFWSSLLWTQDAHPATTRRLNAAVCRLAGRNLSAGEWGAVFSGTELAGHRHRTCPGLPPG
jgi:WD40 repeat protein